MLKSLTTFSLMTLLSITAFAQADKTPLKIGFVYVSPIGEAGWTYTHDQGRRYIDAKFVDRIKTTYVESVAEGADAERVITQMARSGMDLIFTTSFGYMNPTLRVAKRFPKVKFEHTAGYKTSKNVGNYFDRIYQARYLTGVVAGYMTKSNVIGYVAGFPIPEVIRGIDAFTLGLRSVNPKAIVKVVWVNSWYDPGKEREAADSLIQQRADIITQHTDSPGPVQAAEAAGVYAIGYHSDMSMYGKKAHLTAAVHDWNRFYSDQVQAVLDGQWRSEQVWKGFKAGMTRLAPFNPAIPDKVIQKVNALKQAIVSGQLQPFAGPIKAQDGTIIVAEGSVMPDSELLKINTYVEGVESKLEK